MGIKIHYNPSTGKVGYTSSTGKVQVVDDEVTPGIDCDRCSDNVTPLKIKISVSDTTFCCAYSYSSLQEKLTGPWSDYIDKEFILTQGSSAFTACDWSLTEDIPESTLFITLYEGVSTDCKIGTEISVTEVSAINHSFTLIQEGVSPDFTIKARYTVDFDFSDGGSSSLTNAYESECGDDGTCIEDCLTFESVNVCDDSTPLNQTYITGATITVEAI